MPANKSTSGGNSHTCGGPRQKIDIDGCHSLATHFIVVVHLDDQAKDVQAVRIEHVAACLHWCAGQQYKVIGATGLPEATDKRTRTNLMYSIVPCNLKEHATKLSLTS